MNRAERRDLNERKTASRLLSKIGWHGFEGCKTVQDMLSANRRLCLFLTESHNCSCGICRGHMRRHAGNSIHGIPIQEIRQIQFLDNEDYHAEEENLSLSREVPADY